MYLFIFESIGTSELLLIGIVALVIFGPRKLPEMMKKFGKVMADFRRSTNEFKESWEREVAFESLENPNDEKNKLPEGSTENSIGRDSYSLENEIVVPEVKELTQEEFEKVSKKDKAQEENTEEIPKILPIENKKSNLSEKRDWL